MESRKNLALNKILPIKSKLTSAYIISILIVLLTCFASIMGVVKPDLIYPNESLVQTFVPNDVTTLLIGLPILIFSMIATHRAKVIGLQFWLGAVVFNLYNLISYLYALPFQWNFFINLILLGLDLFAIIKLLFTIDGKRISEKIRGHVHEKFCGGVIAAFGILFFVRAILVFIDVIFYGKVLPKAELAPNLSDIIISPVFIIVGISLWKKKALGYIGGLGSLFLAVMLFVGLILFMLIQPILTDEAFSLMDIIIITVMGMVCAIPFVVFIRGVMASSKQAEINKE